MNKIFIKSVLILFAYFFLMHTHVAFAANPSLSAVEIRNSTPTTVEIYATGSNFNSFVHTTGYTADSTDLSNISYNGKHPTSAIIDEAGVVKHITMTFPISMGTAKAGTGLSIQSGTIKNSTTQNPSINFSDSSIVDLASPVVIEAVFTAYNELRLTFSEIVDNTDNVLENYDNFYTGGGQTATLTGISENVGTNRALITFTTPAGIMGLTDTRHIDIYSNLMDLSGNNYSEPTTYYFTTYGPNMPNNFSTCGDLYSINYHLDGDYEIPSYDIDCSGYDSFIIGSSVNNQPFTGSLDGNGHRIVLNINDSSADDVGLFSKISGGSVHDLKLTGTVDSTGNISGPHTPITGALAGVIVSGTDIQRVANFANVNGFSTTGGLVGTAQNSSIVDSYNAGSVTGVGTVGGLISDGQNGNIIERNYNRGSVTSSVYAGGIFGSNRFGGTYTVNDNFNVGFVEGETTGGIFGMDGNSTAGSIQNTQGNYFDVARSGQENCAGESSGYAGPIPSNGLCQGLNNYFTTPDVFKDVNIVDQMLTWDFDTVWETVSGGYPALRSIDNDSETNINDTPSHPNHPSDLTVVNVYGNSVDLSWTNPSEIPTAPLIGYLLDYREQGTEEWIEIDTNIPGNMVNTATIEGLTLGTTYEFKIAVYNGLGASGFNSDEVDPGVWDPALVTATTALHEFEFTAGNNLNTEFGTFYENEEILENVIIFYYGDGNQFSSYSITAGTLPDGVTLNETIGVLEGTPTESGTFTFTVHGEDGNGYADKEFTLFITPELTYQITSCEELQEIRQDPTGSFTLMNDIDCAGTSTWNSDGNSGYYGFEPISNFTGSLQSDGENDFVISNLYINRPGGGSVGIFADSSGTISHITLEDVNITGNHEVGALVGKNENGGVISYAHVSGEVTGVGRVGGLVGANRIGSQISHSSSSATVTGSDVSIGGLTGGNGGTITDSYSTSTVHGNYDTGGLSGRSGGMIIRSYHSGDVDGLANIGGLVGVTEVGGGGYLLSRIVESYATGTVTGASTMGGLVGFNNELSIFNSYSDVAIYDTDGSEFVGGFVGRNSQGYISKSYALGSINLNNFGYKIGGFIGAGGGIIFDSYTRVNVNLNDGGDQVGSFAGRCGRYVTNVYATGSVTNTADPLGGIVGSSDGCNVTDSFWDVDTTGISEGQNASGLGTPANTTDMKDSNTYPDVVPGGSYDLQNVEGGSVTTQYLKFVINKNRQMLNSQSPDYSSISELILKQNNIHIPWEEGTEATILNSGMTAGKIIDNTFNNFYNSYLDYEFTNNGNTSTFIIHTPDNVTFNGYSFATGDSEPYDPAGWELYSSVNGEDWTLIDSRSDVDVTADRHVDVNGSTTGWDFTNIWGIDSSYNDGYPFLRWQDSSPEEEDTTSPVVSNFSMTVGDTGGTVTWDTDESAGYSYSYGITYSLATNTNEDMENEHTFTMEELLACTKYHLLLETYDASNNVSTVFDDDFTTTGCEGNVTPIASSTDVVDGIDAGTFSLTSSSTITINTPNSFTTNPNVEIQIKALDSSDVLTAISKPNGFNPVGAVVFDVKALVNKDTLLDSFDLPVTITYSYSDEDITGLDESTLWVYHYHSGTWSPLDACTVDTGNNTVTCTAPSFSVFALFGQPIVVTPTPSGGGSGGSGYYPKPPVLTVTTPSTPVVVPVATKNTLDITGIPKGFTFKKDLKLKMKDTDVKMLQILLNNNGFPVAKSGVGSKGKETNIFGLKTKAALIKFQEAYRAKILIPQGFKKGTGILGPYSRKILNEMLY